MGALYFAAREAAIEQFDSALSAKAMALSALTFSTPKGVQAEFGNRFFRGTDDSKPRDFFELWDGNWRPLRRSASLGLTAELPHKVGHYRHPRFWNLTLPTHRAGRAIGFAFKPKSLQGAPVSDTALRLVVASDRDGLDETLWGVLAIAAGSAVLLVGATLWIVPRVLRKGLHSLDELGAQAARIDAASLSTRFDTDGLPIELSPIANRLNDLLARLEGSFERERRFSADLAHELRTPIAELRSLTECALKWPQSRDASTDHETLAIAQQMERLVSYILALARAEEGLMRPTFEPIVVDAFLRDTWRPYVESAARRWLTMICDAPAVSCAADVALLRSVLTNLFDNAVDYAPPGSVIAVRATADAARVTITVRNEAPELSRADVRQLFDRFWRKEASRTGGKHVGLGLSLARAFASAMGWTLTADYDNGCIVFTVSGPAAATTPAAIRSEAGPKSGPVD